MEHRAPVPILPVASIAGADFARTTTKPPPGWKFSVDYPPSTTGTHYGIDFARISAKPPPGRKLSVDYHLTTTSGCATGHGAGWLKVLGERTYLLPPGSVP